MKPCAWRMYSGTADWGNAAWPCAMTCGSPVMPLRAATPTFIPEEFKTATQLTSEELTASPTLYPGQRIRASLKADADNPAAVGACLFISFYGADDVIEHAVGELCWISPGITTEMAWTVPDLHGRPVVAVGVQVESDQVQQGCGLSGLADLGRCAACLAGRPGGRGQHVAAGLGECLLGRRARPASRPQTAPCHLPGAERRARAVSCRVRRNGPTMPCMPRSM